MARSFRQRMDRPWRKSDIGGLARAIANATYTARAKQHAFLEHVGLTVTQIQELDAPARQELQQAYAEFVWPRA